MVKRISTVLLALLASLALLLVMELLTRAIYSESELKAVMSDFRTMPQPKFKNFSGTPKFALKTDWTFQKKSPRPPDSTHETHKNEKPHYLSVDTKFNYPLYIKNASVVIESRDSQGELIYSAKYTHDKFHRRITPGAPNANFKSHLILSGCSYIFGEGLDDDQTVSAHLQNLEPHTRIYNLGIQGGSVADAITTLTEYNYWDDIEPKKGMLLVSFDAVLHIPRFLGTLRTLGVWSQYFPALERDEKTGRYVVKGLFIEYQPLLTKIMEWLASSRLLLLLKVDWPKIDDRAYHDYADAINDLRFYYRNKYGLSNQLIVFIYPGSYGGRGIIPHLERLEIPYLDYTELELVLYSDGDAYIAKDGHPSSRLNQALASQIHHDMSLTENKELLREPSVN